jgi:hypothetical protein
VCLGNIYSERPRCFVCAVNHDDLLATLALPDTLMPGPEWVEGLQQRGIIVKDAILLRDQRDPKQAVREYVLQSRRHRLGLP